MHKYSKNHMNLDSNPLYLHKFENIYQNNFVILNQTHENVRKMMKSLIDF